MRYAVVVAPHRFEFPAAASLFAAPQPVGPICALLSRGGRRVLLVHTTPALAVDFALALADVGPRDDVVVCVTARTAVRGESVVVRVGDQIEAGGGGGEWIDLRVLGHAVGDRRPAAALFVLEASHEGGGDDPIAAALHVDDIVRSLDVRSRGFGAMVGARAASVPAEEWPFSSHVVTAIAECAAEDAGGSAWVWQVEERFGAAVGADQRIRSFAVIRGDVDLPIVELPARALEPPAESLVSDPNVWSLPDSRVADPGVASLTSDVNLASLTSDVNLASLTSDVNLASLTSDPSVASLADSLVSDADAKSPAETPEQEPRAEPFVLPQDFSIGHLNVPVSPSGDEAPLQALTGASPDHGTQPSRAGAFSAPETTPDPAQPAHTPSDVAGAADAAVSQRQAAIPEPPPTRPSLPAIEPLLDLADGARERGKLPEALAGYKAALIVIAADDAETRASIYARIGDLKLEEGKQREAELNFEKALRADPGHRRALDALVALATASKELERAVDWRRQRLAALTNGDARVNELRAIADICADQLHDPVAAASALDEALAVEGKNRASLEGLRSDNEKLERWSRVVDVLAQLADVTAEGKPRAAVRFAAADVALRRLHDDDLGMRFLEQGLEDDPRLDEAVEKLTSLRTARGEWGALDAVLSRLGTRWIADGELQRAWQTYGKLGELRRDHEQDATGAVAAFAAAVQCKPEDVELRTRLAEAHLAAGDEMRAVAEFQRIVKLAPMQASAYAHLFAIHSRAGQTDKAWLSASALAEVGGADMDQQLYVDQYRVDGPIRPSRSLDDAAWDELLRAPGSDDVVTSVLRAMVVPAVSTRVEELRQARQLVALDPARRQSASSTGSAVRSFHWAAQVLGVEPPELYVVDNVPGGIAAVHAAVPTTALGPDVLSGLTTKDLAFLAGRHLTYYRPEYYSLICYPTLADLSVLFLGAVKVVLPDLDAPVPLREAVLRKCRVLAKQATDQERRALGVAVERLQARDGRVDLAAWIRGVELSAQRAGLLLCGDLAVGAARLAAEKSTRTIAELSYEDKWADLLSFAVSEELPRARALLGVDAHRSVSVPVPGPGELRVG